MARIIRRPKMDPAQRPFMIVWETTQACDLACKHCRAAAQPNLDPNSLNFEEAKNLLNQSAEFGRPRPFLSSPVGIHSSVQTYSSWYATRTRSVWPRPCHPPVHRC